jgi:hypothetical protein
MIKWSRTAVQNTTYSTHRWDSPLEEPEDYKYHKTGKYGIDSEEEYIYWIERKRAAEQYKPKLKRYHYFRGVTPESPISPLLSTVILNKILLNNLHWRIGQYADDGILYDLTSSPEQILTFHKESGVRVNWAKSHWLRRNGSWEHPPLIY